LATVQDMVRRGELENLSPHRAAAHLIKALGKGLLKIMSKMGVSTAASYTGAQIFEAIGLGGEVIETCFAGTTSRLGGVRVHLLPPQAAPRPRRPFPPPRPAPPPPPPHPPPPP